MNSASSGLQTSPVVTFERAHNPKVADSNPAPQPNPPRFSWRFSFRLHLQHVSNRPRTGVRLHKPDGVLKCSGAEVHIPLRRRQVLRSGQFLNRSGWCPSHGQVRTERVSEDVNPVSHACRSASVSHSDPRSNFCPSTRRVSATISVETARSIWPSTARSRSLFGLASELQCADEDVGVSDDALHERVRDSRTACSTIVSTSTSLMSPRRWSPSRPMRSSHRRARPRSIALSRVARQSSPQRRQSAARARRRHPERQCSWWARTPEPIIRSACSRS